jgi:hypothetical protein
MYVVVQIAKKDSAKAWALLVRHSAGTALPDRTFVVTDNAVRALREAGVKLKEIARVADPSMYAAAMSGERI